MSQFEAPLGTTDPFVSALARHTRIATDFPDPGSDGYVLTSHGPDSPATFMPGGGGGTTVHVLATTAGLGPEHTVSGLTAGQVLRATGATTAAFQALAFADLSGTLTRAQLPAAIAYEDEANTFTQPNSFNQAPAFAATPGVPFTVASTATVTNLNADLLDGQHGAYYLDRANHTGPLPTHTHGRADLPPEIAYEDEVNTFIQNQYIIKATDPVLRIGESGSTYGEFGWLSAANIASIQTWIGAIAQGVLWLQSVGAVMIGADIGTGQTLRVGGTAQIQGSGSSGTLRVKGTSGTITTFLQPFADTDSALYISNAADTIARHVFKGSGDVLLSQGAGRTIIGPDPGATFQSVLHVGGGMHVSSTAVFDTTASFGASSAMGPPFTVSSTLVVTSLNADLLDGQHGAYYLDLANHTGTITRAALPAQIAYEDEVNTFTQLQNFSRWGTVTYPTPGPGQTGVVLYFGQPTTSDDSSGLAWGGQGAAANTTHAAIFVRSSGSYGTKMYFATTDSFGAGAKARMLLDYTGALIIGTDPGGDGLLRIGPSLGGAGRVGLNLTHNTFYGVDDTAGTQIRVIGVASDNNVYVGSIDVPASGGNIIFRTAGNSVMQLTGSALTPMTTGGLTLGTYALPWGSINLAENGWLLGNTVGTNMGLIRSRGMGYSAGYSCVQVGQVNDGIALFVDPGLVTGGTFNGSANEIFLPNLTRINVLNATGNDWTYNIWFGVGFVTPQVAGAVVLGSTSYPFGSLVTSGPLCVGSVAGALRMQRADVDQIDFLADSNARATIAAYGGIFAAGNAVQHGSAIVDISQAGDGPWTMSWKNAGDSGDWRLFVSSGQAWTLYRSGATALFQLLPTQVVSVVDFKIGSLGVFSSTLVPSNDQVLAYNSSTGKWQPKALGAVSTTAGLVVMFDRFGQQSNSSTVLTAVYTYTIPAGTMNANGDSMVIFVAGRGNTQSCETRVRVGSATALTTVGISAGHTFWIQINLTRTGVNSWACQIRYSAGTGTSLAVDMLQISLGTVGTTGWSAESLAVIVDGRTTTSGGTWQGDMSYATLNVK